MWRDMNSSRSNDKKNDEKKIKSNWLYKFGWLLVELKKIRLEMFKSKIHSFFDMLLDYAHWMLVNTIDWSS